MFAVNSATRITFDNILFATDLSRCAEAAVPYVIETARLYGSIVHAVYVKTADWNAPQQQELQRLDQRLGDIPHEVTIEPGDVRTTLLDLADKKGINLIVLGTHGRTGLDRAILGSVAETIFRQATCPVMTVGPGHRPDSGTQSTKEILYATDLTPASAAAAGYALSLAQKHQARLTILTVLPRPKGRETLQSEHQVTLTLRRLEGLVPVETQLRWTPYGIVEQGEPARKILQAAWAYDAGLVVLGIRPHSIGMATHVFRRTAHEVVAGAPCPVLTVSGVEPVTDLELSAIKTEEAVSEMPPDAIPVGVCGSAADPSDPLSLDLPELF